ncbi:unnamed protein product [Didymodactylos carnosus]|uniref:Uncharacterized protein n=1 Tax=Didymodactylos carnosus TaxID=1234261 RepID=A0A814T7X4_9BILA|nr:unnamed protein product [Didymodactylos carnosus]CAF1157798.1 unnamed protein product [Didymodactylos carnosus]CAF3728150.1 unnamed protein product [Didymodactylos carnosus]CAF3921211.1 unnamed protein product [Didymodactylos carnosus]
MIDLNVTLLSVCQSALSDGGGYNSDASYVWNFMATTPSSSTTLLSSHEEKCSDFYIACRTNDIDKVKRILKTYKPADIDYIEPCGSTALHAASFYGYYEIVKLLLGCDASKNIKNKFGLTPSQEAKTPQIKNLFDRFGNSDA